MNITITNCRFESNLGFLIQYSTDIIFDKVTITNSIGEALVLNSASVKSNGAVRSGTIGGPAERFY